MNKALIMAVLILSTGTAAMAQEDGAMGITAPDLPAYFDEAYSGNSVSVAAGSVIEIRLAENPATGYTWNADNLDTRSFQIVYDDFDLEQRVRVFKVKCLRMGSANLEFIYAKPWEGNTNPGKTFNMKLNVAQF